MGKTSWRELSSAQRGMVVGGAVLQVALQAAALRDLHRRVPAQVRGPRWAWACATFVNIVGPSAYFVWGRRRR